MPNWAHRTIIAPAAFQQLAQALCEAAAEGAAGEGMFTTALSATGALPATHYISSGYIFDDFAALLPLTTVEPSTDDGDPDMVTERPGNVAFVEGLAAQAGITLPAGTVAGLFDALDVSEQGPFEAVARLGLVMVQSLAA